jgi:protein O-mannosyl-transferase
VHPPTPARPPRVRSAALLLPPLLAALAYAPSVANGFAYDDVPAIVQNPLLHDLSALPAALAQPYWLALGHLYRPLSQVSWALEWAATGGQPWLFHLLNVLWHAVATLLVTRLAARWLPTAGALAAGLTFALHPVHAEAIANVVGRSEVVAAALLAALGLVVSAGAERPSRERLTAAALLSAAALASKEVGVVAPAIAFGLAWARPGRPRDAGAAWRYALASVAGVVPLLLARWLVLGTLGGDKPHQAFAAAAPPQEALLVLGALPRAAALLLAPLVPRIDWAPPMSEVREPSLVLAALGVPVVLAVAAALVMHVRRPTAWTTAAWFAAATIAPTSNLLFRSGVVLAERTLYTPSVGACLLLGAAVAAAWERVGWRRPATAVAAAAWLAAAAVISVRENAVWHDNDRLAAAMLARAPQSYRSHMMVGSVARERGDYEGARTHYRHAVALFRDDAGMLVHTATLEARFGDRAAAASLLRRALELEPNRRSARTLLARYLLALGDAAGARAVLEEGLRREPDQRIWRRWVDSLRTAGK